MVQNCTVLTPRARKSIAALYVIGPALPEISMPCGTACASVRLEMGVTPSPLIPTTTPSSHGCQVEAGRNAKVGKEFARVTPALLFGYLSNTWRIARRIGTMDVTAAVSLKSFGTSGSPTCKTQSMILAGSAAFWDTISPSVPSPPCGHESEYSMPMAPAASSLRVFDCQPSRSCSSLPVTGPPVEAIVSRSGHFLTSWPISRQTRSSECPETLSALAYV